MLEHTTQHGNTEQTLEKGAISRWLYLALGITALLFAGILYAWSILKAPLAETFGWGPAELALNFTLTLCFFALGGLGSGLLAKKTSSRLRLLFSAVMVFGGFFIASRLSGESLLPLYLAYGVLAGLGIGIAYNTVIATTNAWFPDRKGLSSGALMMGFGASTLALGSLAGNLIATPEFGWRNTYLLLAILIGGVLLLTALLLRLPPADMVFPSVPGRKGTDLSGGQHLFAGQMLHRVSFWKLFCFFFLLASLGSTVISFAKDFALSVGAVGGFAVTMVGLLSICNGLGRICSGSFFDAVGLRATQILTSAVAIAAPSFSLLGVLFHSLPLGALGLCLCGFAYGFAPTLSAAFIGSFYGTKYFALNFSIINMVLIPASFIATLAGKLVAASGSYVGVFLLLIAFSVVGLGINLSVKKP